MCVWGGGEVVLRSGKKHKSSVGDTKFRLILALFQNLSPFTMLFTMRKLVTLLCRKSEQQSQLATVSKMTAVTFLKDLTDLLLLT